MECILIKISNIKRYQLLAIFKEFSKAPLSTLQHLQENYGDFIYCPPPANTLIVLDPILLKNIFTNKTDIIKGSQAGKLKALVGNGLFSTEGNVWRKQRRELAPLFHHKYINQHRSTIKEMTLEHLEDWKDGDEINLTNEITKLTFNISGKILFGGIPEYDLDAVRSAVEVSGEVIFKKISSLLPSPYWLPTKDNKRFLGARDTLDNISDQLIKQAMDINSNSNDLLSMMLTAGVIDHGELRDQIKTMMIAGHDTTSTFILWTIIMLVYHPEILDDLKTNLLADEKFVESLSFRNVLNESLRIYPPSAIISRKNTREIELGGNVIVKGTNIITSQYILGRDKRIWEDADTFNPARFFDINLQDDVYKYSFFPFSIGARKCVGENLAYLEASIIIAEIIKKFSLQPKKSFYFSTQSICDLILKPKHDFIVKIY